MNLAGEFVAGIDLVDICLWAFTIFFFGLVFYLQRESMREGYPLETDTTGKVDTSQPFWKPKPKVFKQPHGRPDVVIDGGPRDTRDLALARSAPWPGAPYVPTGDPMLDGVGPASYAERLDEPDLTLDGDVRIAPYRVSPGYEVLESDVDPRGLPVRGCDGQVAGEVVDLWVDRSEAIIRYFEVAVPLADGTTRNVLTPVPFCVVKGGLRPGVDVEAITAAQFANVPGTKLSESVTRLEEDKICGYYGGGKLYATKDREEPFL